MPAPNVYEQGEALRDAMYTHGRQKSGDIITNLLNRMDEMGRDLEEARKTLVNAGEAYASVVQENEFLKGSLATCGRLINEVRDVTEANANECSTCANVRAFVGNDEWVDEACGCRTNQVSGVTVLCEAHAEPEEGSDDSE